MKYHLLTVLVLSSFVGQVLCSEKEDGIITFKAHVGRLNTNPLRYCDKKYIDFLNTDYGIQCDYNEPFLMIYFPWHRGRNDRWASEEEQNLRKIVEAITFVPYKYFMNDNADPRNSNVCFKKHNVELLSCSKQFAGMENGFRIQLNSDFAEMDPKNLLHQFKEVPRCEPGHVEGGLLIVVSTEDLEKELCDAGIICKVGHDYGYGHDQQKYEQGRNSYFGDEVIKKIEAKNQEISTIGQKIQEMNSMFHNIATMLDEQAVMVDDIKKNMQPMLSKLKQNQRQQESVQQPESSYSRIKKLFFIGGSIAAIIAYFWYQKFYATAH